jgi:hypothetical protein
LDKEELSMGKPTFSEFGNEWSKEQWLDYCGGWKRYKVKDADEFPDWMPNTLADKFNSATVGCSGNDEVSVFILTGYRIDGDAIDEHPYVVVFQQGEEKAYSGFIHHANYEGRTSEIPAEMEELMKKGGVTVAFNFKRKPTRDEGTLEDMQEEGLLNGFVYATGKALKERKQKKRKRAKK